MAGTMEGNGVNKLILTALCALVLVGCSGNQQKLEACMETAKSAYVIAGTVKLRDLGCAGAAYGQSEDRRPECVATANENKAWRIAEEDRCVKLYK